MSSQKFKKTEMLSDFFFRVGRMVQTALVKDNIRANRQTDKPFLLLRIKLF